jgi:hypothetical protein
VPRRNGPTSPPPNVNIVRLLVAAVSGPPDDEGMTAQELAVESGQTVDTVQRRLKTLEVQGRLIIGFRRGKDSRGRNYRFPVYRLRKETDEKK